jgi:hypothetical protein
VAAEGTSTETGCDCGEQGGPSEGGELVEALMNRPFCRGTKKKIDHGSDVKAKLGEDCAYCGRQEVDVGPRGIEYRNQR